MLSAYELSKGKHTISFRNNTTATLNTGRYSYFIDYIDIVKDGIGPKHAKNVFDYSDNEKIELQGSLTGQKAGDFSVAAITYTSNNPRAVTAKADGTVKANGPGDADIQVKAVYDGKEYITEVKVTGTVDKILVSGIEKTVSGTTVNVRADFLNNGEADKTVSLVTVLLNGEGKSLSVTFTDVNVPEGQEAFAEMSYTNFTPGNTIKAFVIDKAKFTPLSQMEAF